MADDLKPGTPKIDRAALDREAASLEADLLADSYVPDVTGAPMKVRFLVGLAKDEPSQLATLQKYQQSRGADPDAEWIDHTVQKSVNGTGYLEGKRGEDPHSRKPTVARSLIYTDPDTGKRTLVNPPGADMGDLAAHSRDLARMLAFAGGAAVGSMTPVPGGAGIGGVAASQGTDELIDRVLAPKLGVVTGAAPFGSAEHLLQRGADAALEGGTMLAGGAGGKALKAIGEVATPGSGGMGPGLARLRIPGAAGSGDRATVEAAEALGIKKVPSAVASKSTTVHALTDSALKNPYTNEAMQPQYDKFMRDVRAAMEKGLGTGAPEGQVGKQAAGMDLARGLSTWKDNAKQAIDQTEMTMDHMMYGKGVDLNPVADYANETVQRYGQAVKLPPEYKRLTTVAAENNGQVPWDVVRVMRTDIGRQLEDATARDKQYLAPLYAKLSQQLEASAKAGGPQMQQMWTDAMEYERAVAQEWSQVRSLAEQPQVEQAFNMLAGSANQGPSLMEAVKAKVPATTWDRLVATMARDKALVTRDQQRNLAAAGGKQLDAVMSPTAYAKWYRDLKKSGSLDVAAPPGTDLRKSLDNFAEIGSAMERSGAMQTFSNSPSGIRYTEMLEGMPADARAPSLVGEKPGLTQMADKAAGWALNKTMDAYRAQSARIQAKLLSDPEFTKWMLDSKAIKPRDPSGWNAHVSRLTGIAMAKPDLRGDLMEYVRTLDAQEAPQQMANELAKSPKVAEDLKAKARKDGIRTKE